MDDILDLQPNSLLQFRNLMVTSFSGLLKSKIYQWMNRCRPRASIMSTMTPPSLGYVCSFLFVIFSNAELIFIYFFDLFRLQHLLIPHL